jgi:hypothetical protein
VCFSGIGGMMSVGWRFTSVARNEANSEYLRLTSRPCLRISTVANYYPSYIRRS